MQRRLAQLHSAMGDGTTAMEPLGPADAPQVPPPRIGVDAGARDVPKKPWATRPLWLMAALLLAGFVIGALSQRQSSASEPLERNPIEAMSTAQASSSTPVSPVEPAATTPSEDDAIRDMLERWRLDWSRRDVPAYLGHYSTQFEPATGIARAQWAEQRQQALLNRPAIRIEMQDLRIERPNPQEARVHFLQTYLSGRYQENAQPKTLRLLQEDGGWRIAGEWQGSGPAQTPSKP